MSVDLVTATVAILLLAALCVAIYRNLRDQPWRNLHLSYADTQGVEDTTPTLETETSNP